MSEYEQVLKQIGSFGPCQRKVFILVSMFETPAAWAMLLPILLNVTPKWICTSSHINSTFNDSGSWNISQHNISDAETTNVCSADGNVCPGIQFTDDFTSIVSEVNMINSFSTEWTSSSIHCIGTT